jgi:hypothetical protein
MNHGLDFTSKGRGKGTQTPSPCPTPPSPLKPSDGKLTQNSHSSWYIKRGHFTFMTGLSPCSPCPPW